MMAIEEPLSAIEELIRRAGELPAPQPYHYSETPLQDLQRRMGGEEPVPQEEPQKTAGPLASERTTVGGETTAATSGGGADEMLGGALRESLQSRPLSGASRARLAEEIARLMAEPALRPKMRPLFDLLLFDGEGGDGNGKGGD